jgi:hypothetical protein
VHLIDEGIDTGDIICRRAFSLVGISSVSQLRAAVDRAHIEFFGEVVVRYIVIMKFVPPSD